MWKLFISHWNNFSLILLGNVILIGRATKSCKQFNFWELGELPLYEITEYALKETETRLNWNLHMPITGLWLSSECAIKDN